MKIEIASATKEETAYDKWVVFKYEGQEYSVLLHWDKWDGFDLTFTEVGNHRQWIDAPDWAITWDEDNEDSLGYTLEELSDNLIEESYL
jgi:hypothetical protein